MYGFTESDSPQFEATGDGALKPKRRGFWNWKTLAVFTGLLAVIPSIVALLANLYWINAPLAESLEGYRPTNILDGVPIALISALVLGAAYFGLFFYPVLRLGRVAIAFYLGLNGLGALWVSAIYWSLADPSNHAGWESLALVLVAFIPVVLGISLVVLTVTRWSRNERVLRGRI